MRSNYLNITVQWEDPPQKVMHDNEHFLCAISMKLDSNEISQLSDECSENNGSCSASIHFKLRWFGECDINTSSTRSKRASLSPHKQRSSKAIRRSWGCTHQVRNYTCPPNKEQPTSRCHHPIVHFKIPQTDEHVIKKYNLHKFRGSQVDIYQTTYSCANTNNAKRTGGTTFWTLNMADRGMLHIE